MKIKRTLKDWSKALVAVIAGFLITLPLFNYDFWIWTLMFFVVSHLVGWLIGVIANDRNKV